MLQADFRACCALLDNIEYTRGALNGSGLFKLENAPAIVRSGDGVVGNAIMSYSRKLMPDSWAIVRRTPLFRCLPLTCLSQSMYPRPETVCMDTNRSLSDNLFLRVSADWYYFCTPHSLPLHPLLCVRVYACVPSDWCMKSSENGEQSLAGVCACMLKST